MDRINEPYNKTVVDRRICATALAHKLEPLILFTALVHRTDYDAGDQLSDDG